LNMPAATAAAKRKPFLPFRLSRTQRQGPSGDASNDSNFFIFVVCVGPNWDAGDREPDPALMWRSAAPRRLFEVHASGHLRALWPSGFPCPHHPPPLRERRTGDPAKSHTELTNGANPEQLAKASGGTPSRAPSWRRAPGHCVGPQTVQPAGKEERRKKTMCWSPVFAPPPPRPRIDRLWLKGHPSRCFRRAGRKEAS